MLGKIFGVICAISFVFALFCDNMGALAGAVIDGAADAVALTVSLVGSMALWCGIMRVLERAGAIGALSRLISPILKLFFPDSYKSGRCVGKLSASIAANMIGIGNAATPFAISAMKRMQEENPTPEWASDDMVTLAVLNCSPPSLLPTTLITLRRAAGSAMPYSIVAPVWICSFTCALFALVISRAFSVGRRRG